MKIHSPLADMEIGIDKVRREANDLVLFAHPASSVDARIVIPAGELLCTLGKVLVTPSALLFVLGLPFFWLRQRLGSAHDSGASRHFQVRTADINKPW
jgi:hypothetical protein